VQDYLGLLEMFIVFAIVLGIAILELVCLRLDKKRKQVENGHTTDKP
jgi:hypothetical protein